MCRNKYFNPIFIILQIFLCLFLSSSVFAATYYIDYARGSDSNNGKSTSTPWKRCPGMKGFSTIYTHSSGDKFVFKGGVKWPATALPLTIGYSGTSEKIDTYTVDVNWHTGGAYSNPIFDGEMSLGAYNNGAITAKGKSYILINGIQIQNTGDATTCSGNAISFDGGSYIEVSNCNLQPTALQAFAYSNSNSNQNHIYFYDNKLSKFGRFIVYGDQGYVLDDVRIYNNTITYSDISSSFTPANGKPFCGYHLDGLMIGDPLRGNSGNTCATKGTATVTNIQFHHNMIRGDWNVNSGASGMYYSNGCTNIANIYDNVFAIENTSTSGPMNGFIWTYTGDGNYTIYNNTFSSDSAPGYGAGAMTAITLDYNTYGTHTIKNNIFSGFGNDIVGSTKGGATYVIDYNLHNVSTAHGYGHLLYINTTSCDTLSACRSMGYEKNGKTGDPKFVAIPNGTIGSGDWHLQLGSPAGSNGVNLGTPYAFDIEGNTRSASWSIGAYQRIK